LVVHAYGVFFQLETLRVKGKKGWQGEQGLSETRKAGWN
jgi:hypothetical protein